ncbi:hypothetical protein [Pseudovibrio sp. Ad37]|uniref:hypothetical protein n=1 Tax=Pseudovibrio sp. Ad37 TaxID=989422 RepID=UPI0007AE8CC8|nr:hypothetical protein [Pseudovibrio sp. Ad37]KZL19048.1 hypothetical protein PsAD37_03739 [Pseudovibrio sp. Ad37]
MRANLDALRSCAQDNLEAIQSHWAKQGYLITGKIEYRISADGTGYFAVITDLVNGRPWNFKQRHLEQMKQHQTQGRMM